MWLKTKQSALTWHRISRRAYRKIINRPKFVCLICVRLQKITCTCSQVLYIYHECISFRDENFIKILKQQPAIDDDNNNNKCAIYAWDYMRIANRTTLLSLHGSPVLYPLNNTNSMTTRKIKTQAHTLKFEWIKKCHIPSSLRSSMATNNE